ncbi:D-2-hydroxyacid dehydrogenase [Ktedonospora formicarum]|uniref:3-phosphoglycerate dehydrogenase n=1 Tax=Ktedonospora formicarum TaxID=2778364 RepID=A0A8J3I2C5_9CHLR|nr:D-2-hydroxyacid dehydrogenase [Ktedonospora formicarum]GHO43629.1 3-phosphoglycerate dehydrogenase [Ktedonospora formicarum]
MTQVLQVASTFPFSPEAQQRLSEAAGSTIRYIGDSDELRESLREVEILCAYWLPANWRKLAPNLRWLQASGAGVDGLRLSGILASESGVRVTTAVGIHAITIGEYVFASMLMYNRTWPAMVRLQDRHLWPRSANWYKLGGRELAEQTLGIVGLGSIGRRVAHLGKAFGMRVLATKRTVNANQSEENIDQLYPISQLHDMLHQCDYVVLAVPLTAESEHLIGEAELHAMREHTYLVNVARGRVIDERALITALREGWIGGAGLDVTEEEPLPADSPLFSLPNVILTPHISGESVHYNKRLSELFADNLRRYRAGEPLHNMYEPSRGY